MSAARVNVHTEMTKPATKPADAPDVVGPLKPRRGLFALLMLCFAAWVVALIVMYVTLVYPQRHGSTSPAVQETPAAENR